MEGVVVHGEERRGCEARERKEAETKPKAGSLKGW